MELPPRKKFIPLLRLGGVAVAGLALFYVFSRVNLTELAHTLRFARPGWLLATVAVYGLVFLPAAWRWHLMLRLTGSSVHPGATVRMTLIGHLFYTMFFGAAGGDLAKSALYARWYQWPLPQILAAAPLDRLLGLGGLILFIVLAFGLAALNGSFMRLSLPSFNLSPGRVIIFMVLIVLIWIILKRWGKRSGLPAILRAFKEAGGRLLHSWTSTWQGLTCGFLVQVALAASLAFGLQAVSRSPVPWGRLLWTFPVISVASALPFNIAGMGLREGAVLALFSLYGVSPADAVAASLLTLVARLFWAAVGGIVLWREQRWQSSHKPLTQTLSVIVPASDDVRLLHETVRRLQTMSEVCEIMIVDGGHEGTRDITVQTGCRPLPCASGSTGQLCLGAAQAKGDVILLLPADVSLSPSAGRAVLNCLRDASVVGGGFWKTFRAKNPPRRVPQFNHVFQSLLGRCFPAGQLLFVRREALLAVDGNPDDPLREESELCSRLRKLGRLALVDAVISESPGNPAAALK